MVFKATLLYLVSLVCLEGYNPFSDSVCYENHVHNVKWREPIRERTLVYNKPITEQEGDKDVI